MEKFPFMTFIALICDIVASFTCFILTLYSACLVIEVFIITFGTLPDTFPIGFLAVVAYRT